VANKVGGGGGEGTGLAAPGSENFQIEAMSAPVRSHGPQLAAAGTGGNTTMHVTINAVDAASFVALAHRNRSGLAAAIQVAARENNPIGRRR
jgi:hypothetical protein